jgi:hypothetical protein
VTPDELEQPTLGVNRTGAHALGNGESATHMVGTWLKADAPVESVLHVHGGRSTWVHHELAPRPTTRHEAACAAVRTALNEAGATYQWTQTAPHARTVSDIARRDHGIKLSGAEIAAARGEVMGA